MYTAHTCFRSALNHTFRPSAHRGALALSIPEFLVPAFRHPPSSTFRFPASPPCFESVISHRRPYSISSEKRSSRPEQTSIPPTGPFENVDQRDIQYWLDELEHDLPPQLRRNPSSSHDVAFTPSIIHLSGTLVAAQTDNHDLLSHLGLVEQRWNAVVWVVRTILDNWPSQLTNPLSLELSTNVVWPYRVDTPLEELTKVPVWIDRVQPSRKLERSLDELTEAPRSIRRDYGLFKKALGRVWKSLGSLILEAVDASSPARESEIMSHVLEIIAHLHHTGMVPESIYKYQPTETSSAFHQPPMLHLLSKEILTALSDASWTAREAAVTTAKEKLNASYFLGREIPGSRFKIPVVGINPEVWLEFVLWACLHGGWIQDGAEILQRALYRTKGTVPWKLICWRELMDASRKSENTRSKGWGLFDSNAEGAARPDYRKLTYRTISSEVVAAFVDGLINTIRVGVGWRGDAPETVLAHFHHLKRALETNNLSLGSASWDSIILRVLETEGLVPENRPNNLLKLLDIAADFGEEASSINVPSAPIERDGELPYFFIPSAAPVGLLHRALESFVQMGDLRGVVDTVAQLQRYTDNNKKRSMMEFFEKLRRIPIRDNAHFTSTFAPIEYPGFYPQIPPRLLGDILTLVANNKDAEAGKALLVSEHVDGPLISHSLFYHNAVAASVVRFGHLVRDEKLVMSVVKRTASHSSKDSPWRLPTEVFTAFLVGQIQLQRWGTVEKMQNHMLQDPNYRPPPEIVAAFGAQLLVSSQKDRKMAQSAFTDFMYRWEDLILTSLREELNCIMSILSTVHDEWERFCTQFIVSRGKQPIHRLPTHDFNLILRGVLDAYDSLQGKKLVETWCYPARARELVALSAPGGLPAMPQYRVDKSQECRNLPKNIELKDGSGAPLILQGRIRPNIQTILDVMRKAQMEEHERLEAGIALTEKAQGELEKMVDWLVQFLHSFGYPYEGILDNLGNLAHIPHERPLEPDRLGKPSIA